jgi:hypothetical protein
LLTRWCTKLPGPLPGALIALAWSRELSHVALLTDAGTLIHAFDRPPPGAVIERPFRGMWRARFYAGAWALPGVRYG